MKSFHQIVLDVLNLRWGTDDSAPPSFVDIGADVIIAVQQANDYLWHLRDWNWRCQVFDIELEPGIREYAAPNGKIYDVRVDGGKLSSSDYKLENGMIVFANIPSGAKKAEIWHFTFDAAKRPKQNLESPDEYRQNLESPDDVLNLERYKYIEPLYRRALILKARLNLNSGMQAEVYPGALKEFKEAMESLFRTSAIRRDTRIVI